MTNETPQSNNGRLSTDERAEMKRTFMAYIEENPAKTPERTASLSPYFPRIVSMPAFAMASFLFILTGSTYAAEQSLPNDLLYPFKTNVIEPVFFEAPAFSQHAKARANTTLIARRLAEARELLDESALSAEVASSLTAEVSERAEAVDLYVTVAAASGDVSGAFEIGNEIETTLDANSEVFASMAQELGIAGGALEELVTDVEGEANEAITSGDQIEAAASAGSAEEIDELLTLTHEEIGDTLAEVRASAEELPEGTIDELVQDAELLLVEAEAARAASATARSAGATREAIEDARDSLRAAKRAEIFLDSYEESLEN